MSDKELNEISLKIKRLKKEVTKSKAASRRFLIEMGVLTPKGNITRRYQHVLCIQQGRV
jgi:hypothetical protein